MIPTDAAFSFLLALYAQFSIDVVRQDLQTICGYYRTALPWVPLALGNLEQELCWWRVNCQNLACQIKSVYNPKIDSFAINACTVICQQEAHSQLCHSPPEDLVCETKPLPHCPAYELRRAADFSIILTLWAANIALLQHRDPVQDAQGVQALHQGNTILQSQGSYFFLPLIYSPKSCSRCCHVYKYTDICSQCQSMNAAAMQCNWNTIEDNSIYLCEGPNN